MRITKLDGLRGIFSLGVLSFHYPFYYLPESVFNFFVFRESYTLVDFFFVLSGFVISLNYNTIDSKENLWSYLKKRFIRIYPLLFYSTVLFLVFEIAGNLLFPNLINTHQSLQISFIETIDTILLMNSTPIFSYSEMGMNYPSWSISSEMISYFIFGIVCFKFKKKKRVFAFVIIILLSFLFFVWKKHFFFFGNYGFIRGLLSFCFGFLVWILSQKKFKLNNNLEFVIPIVLLILFFQLNSYEGEFKQMVGLFTIPLFFSFSILTLIKTDGFLSRILENKSLQFLGKVSYSIYLNHALLIIIVPRAIFRILKIPQNDISELLVFIGTIVIVIFYSNFTYKYVELKVGKMLRKKLIKH